MAVKIFFCGDFVNCTGNSNFIDSELKEIIKNCDFSVVNFEASITYKDMNPIPKVGPHLYQSRESVFFLKQAGFNIVSIANNHIYDFGQKGLEETINELERNGILYVGGGKNFDEAYEAKFIERNKTRIGLLAACENEFGCLYEYEERGGYAWIFHPLIEDKIREIKQKVDFLIFIGHAGVEDVPVPLKEWRERYRRLCDLGVDVVVGHHPHVPQGYEKYNNSLIFFSLGNFYFDTPAFANKGDDSYSVVINFLENREIVFEIIYHKKENLKVKKVKENEVNFTIGRLNDLLQNNYEQNHNKMCVDLFNKYYYSYYVMSITPSPKMFILSIIKRLLGKKSFDFRKLLLLHNIRIDSHRFLVQRALSLLYEKTKGESG